ncbi:hypothetical protein PHMEG_0006843 [Phytophthora megakarya]|uniref:SWIM-type domain-containing protein n=1 Tax=Phytophthora megakarya TaxID=4795 RepID=A0A225WMW6_9STRA|nr:hypothetical protein PHMEG_0006843 [Phytophthora megakarya]
MLRKEERYATIADAIAVVEAFAEQTQQRHVRVQQKPNADLGENPAPLCNAVVLECDNAPSCKWFVRLLFVKGEKRWKISSMNVEHHKTNCVESKRTATEASTALGFASSLTTEQLLASANVSAAAALAAASSGEAAAMGASVYAGMVFLSWKEAIGAVRALAHQMGRRAMAEKATPTTWRGKSVMARRVVCQNHRNSNCGWMVVLDEATDEADRYTVLSMSLLHSKECLETCNFSARKKEASAKADSSVDLFGSAQLNPSLLVDDISKYQLTHEMRWSTGKDATKAISDFALVVQRKRSKLCKRNNGGSNKKYVCSDEQCLWFVQLVKGWKSKNWKISAMNLKHSETCTGVAKPTARQLAEMRFFRQAVITHSKSSGKLLTDNFLMHSESGIQIPRGMAYRAQRLVVATSTDDLTESYKFIPSLIESFAKKNPGSIATYEKDPHGHFIRAFVMPNSSMAVLADQQQICGIHVIHYDTVSYQGCMALLVTRDGSFEYQAMAFALLPTNELDHMTWFITLTKRGGARFDGNPVFCAHSEHALLRVLAHETHHAKILFCVHSLLEEMARDKNIPALGPLEEKVWELQQQESEEGFLKTLGDLEALNAAAAAFLRAVHPKNWAYYLNRSVRLYRWASTGADEAVVGSDIQRSDEAPFDLMYTFLAFLMDSIFKKSQVASKLLAVEGARPKITYRMDLALRTCTCGQMFQLGLPCRHFIAATLHFSNEAVLVDSFDPIYRATPYAETHRNLRIEIPAAGDLHKDQSLLPAISARNTKYKKRPRSAGSNSSVTSTSVDTSTAVMNVVTSVMSVTSEDSSAPLAKTPRLDFDSDVVNSLGEIV